MKNLIHLITRRNIRREILQKNPYRFLLHFENLREKTLEAFCGKMIPLFSESPVTFEKEESGIQLVNVKTGNTVEWNIRQGPIQLLAVDLAWIFQQLTPTFLRRKLWQLKKHYEVFMATDDLDMELHTNYFSRMVPARNIRLSLRLSIYGSQGNASMFFTGRKTIHFADALKIIVLKSVYRIKRLPKALKRFSGRQFFRNYGISEINNFLPKPFMMVKKIWAFISNKRN